MLVLYKAKIEFKLTQLKKSNMSGRYEQYIFARADKWLTGICCYILQFCKILYNNKLSFGMGLFFGFERHSGLFGKDVTVLNSWEVCVKPQKQFRVRVCMQ